MFWQGIPQKWTISKEEAERRYSTVHEHIDGVLTYSDGTHTPRIGDHNNLTVYIDRCSPWYVMMKHKWEHSATLGGYVEAVTSRYLRRNVPDLTWETRGKYYKDIENTIQTLSEKYGLETRTQRAVNDHIYNELRYTYHNNPSYNTRER